MSYRKMRERFLERPGLRAAYDSHLYLSKLGRFMQRVRLGKNLKQQDLADLSGVAQGDISRLEVGQGENGPTFLTLVRLAHAQKMRLVMQLEPIEEGASSAESEALEATQALVLRESF
jgi:transcriptional regulator with XRE-family HTH domain